MIKKQIIFITLTVLALGCNAQEPDTLTYYSIEYVDSLSLIIQDKENAIDSLITESNVSSTLMIADTFNYTIEGLTDSLKVSIEKIGGHVKMGLKNGEKIIFYVDF